MFSVIKFCVVLMMVFCGGCGIYFSILCVWLVFWCCVVFSLFVVLCISVLNLVSICMV